MSVWQNWPAPMVTLADQLDYQADIDAISVLAIAALVDELDSFSSAPPEQAATLARTTVPLITAEFGAQTAAVAADFYDETRFSALGTTAALYTATLAPEQPEDVIQDSLGWALAPLFAPSIPDFETAFRRIAAKTQLFTTEAGRDTIARSAEGDPVGTKYARHASANACAFCRMLATRGEDYNSKASAETVVGRIDPRTGTSRGLRSGGTRPLGEKYHPNCRCVAVPVFPGDTYEAAPYVADWAKQYEAVVKKTGTKRNDLKALLATWREDFGAR